MRQTIWLLCPISNLTFILIICMLLGTGTVGTQSLCRTNLKVFVPQTSNLNLHMNVCALSCNQILSLLPEKLLYSSMKSLPKTLLYQCIFWYNHFVRWTNGEMYDKSWHLTISLQEATTNKGNFWQLNLSDSNWIRNKEFQRFLIHIGWAYYRRRLHS